MEEAAQYVLSNKTNGEKFFSVNTGYTQSSSTQLGFGEEQQLSWVQKLFTMWE